MSNTIVAFGFATIALSLGFNSNSNIDMLATFLTVATIIDIHRFIFFIRKK